MVPRNWSLSAFSVSPVTGVSAQPEKEPAPGTVEARAFYQKKLVDLIFLHAHQLDAMKGREPTPEEARQLKGVLHYGRERLEALKREDLVTDYEAAQIELLLVQFERKLVARGIY